MILNGKAMCSMHMGNFEEAEALLLESLNKIRAYSVILAQTAIYFFAICKKNNPKYRSLSLSIHMQEGNSQSVKFNKVIIDRTAHTVPCSGCQGC